jgi:hypothetical protein
MAVRANVIHLRFVYEGLKEFPLRNGDAVSSWNISVRKAG